ATWDRLSHARSLPSRCNSPSRGWDFGGRDQAPPAHHVVDHLSLLDPLQEVAQLTHAPADRLGRKLLALPALEERAHVLFLGAAHRVHFVATLAQLGVHERDVPALPVVVALLSPEDREEKRHLLLAPPAPVNAKRMRDLLRRHRAHRGQTPQRPRAKGNSEL